jgi:hypothetical protein
MTKSDSVKTGADDHDFPSDLIKLAIAHAKSDDEGQKPGASDAAYSRRDKKATSSE